MEPLLVEPGFIDGSARFWLAVATVLTGLYIWIRFNTDTEFAVQYTVPLPPQCQDDWRPEILSNPSIKIPGTTAIQCYAPATGANLGMINPSTPDGIDRAINRAAEAQEQWKLTTFAERRKVLKTMLKFVLDHQNDIAKVACLDSGKTRVDAGLGEILVTAEKLRWTIDYGEAALRPERRPTNLLMMYKRNEVRYEPLGVVAACVSWNYPFHNLIGPVISALFSGNAIVVKGSEMTAWSSGYFLAIARGALQACCHSPQLVQSITCWPSVAPHLTSHPKISQLTFIGSRRVALDVAASAAKSLTPCCMELGGKDAAIVLDDVGNDIERVVATLVRGVFQGAGQSCVGMERIICLPEIYPIVVSKMHAIIQKLRVGPAQKDDGTMQEVDIGACISSARFGELTRLINGAVAQGAKLLHGGVPYNHPDHPQGHYFTPTLLVDVTPTMEIAREELFAPIAVIMRASSIDDAISIANSTEYGLGSSLFGKDRADLAKLTAELQAGMVAVNDFAVYYAVQLPFGGVKGSGYGRFAGEEGLRSLCAQKSVCDDWIPSLIKTSIPGPMRTPYMDEKKAWNMTRGIVELGYGLSLREKAKGLMKIIGI